MIHSISHTMTHYQSKSILHYYYGLYYVPNVNNSQFIVKNKYRIWDLLGRF